MIYVDEPIHKFGRMIMCHMIADTTEELLDMCNKIGVDSKWIQYPNTYREHFDICKTKRLQAIKNGAVRITSKELIIKVKRKKK